MVVLPYKDSLLLFSRYFATVMMESLRKRPDAHWDCPPGELLSMETKA